MSRVTYMPRFCCVIGCRNTDKLPGLSVFFFRIPKLAKKQGVAHEKLLRERGEREFVVRLVQTPEHWRVCGKHFVSEPKTHRAPESISKRCHEGKQLADFEIADVKHQMSMNKERMANQKENSRCCIIRETERYADSEEEDDNCNAYPDFVSRGLLSVELNV
ncbi:uncharacterized protein LOC125042737 isoform X2 [Penaeus chinensis]|uniref:uncharacterized protein LOC125042737 isoform X2 n=1 Tax=Penaeus chinensis TaxID=139456 RepID=UPI001FB85584|nr:uncharacterized protein LOC125042737 isoform X2 [Penaeus chinensis]XP_047494549.1 uncharacterized protein LOC125042737 isoform X2 [Penaeus chinensis]